MFNRISKKIGIDTDNCFSWLENEKYTLNYKPKLVRRGNFLHTNYIVFSELIHLLESKNPNLELNKKKVLDFLHKNNIKPIKKKEVDQGKVEKILAELLEQKKKNKWSAGTNDLRIIVVYYIAGMDSISTNNLEDFKEPCKYLNLRLDKIPIIEPGSYQDVNRMLRDIYRKKKY